MTGRATTTATTVSEEAGPGERSIGCHCGTVIQADGHIVEQIWTTFGGSIVDRVTGGMSKRERERWKEIKSN